MKPERWQQISQLFDAAQARDKDQRAAFLRDACAGDVELRREVELLFAQEGSGFVETRPPGLGTTDLRVDLIGRQIGSYKVLSPIGAGGMGEVYRARDTKLGRDVAIKVLPARFAEDRDRVARFEREARMLATLNHPHIGAIYGFENASSVYALVLELVDGPTLGDRLSNGPLPPAEALNISRQITEALEAAHERGIIHRDLKPANIKITPDGTVKVLDFGIGKAVAGKRAALDLSQFPTMTIDATSERTIVGTPAYMSPEQSRGQPVDKRADIWAFGCVLYEMFSGRRPFDGEDDADVVAKILQREPDYTVVDRIAPPSVRRLVRRCLEKDPKRRLADIADARFDLDEPVAPQDQPVRARGRMWIPAAVTAAALVGAIAAMFVAPGRSSPPPSGSTRFLLNLPHDMTDLAFVAVSPNGRFLAFNGATAGSPYSLWLRPLNAISARVLPGTEGAGAPVWSPDSRFVAFSARGSLKRIDITSGAVSTISSAATGGFGLLGLMSWGAQDTLIFPRDGALHRVSSTGGSAAVVLRPEGEAGYAYPSFLPGGNRFLFADVRTLVPQRGGATIYAGSLGSEEKRELVRADSGAAYANGHLLFVRDRTLMAQPFDAVSSTLTADAFPIAENLWAGAAGTAVFSASETGVLAFPFRDVPPSQLVWLDRTGKPIGAIIEPGDYSNPRVSPDGRKLAVCIYDRQARSRDIWVLDLERGSRTKLTQDPADDIGPTWSPDGTTIAFSSDRTGQRDIYRKAAHGGSEDLLVYTAPSADSVTDWSPDGQQIVFHGFGEISLTGATSDGGAKPTRWYTSKFPSTNGQFSPDGRWIAFSSSESGRTEIYVAPVSGPGGKVTVSTSGGIQPRWSRDGKELYYLNLSRDRLIGVPVKTQGVFEAGAVRELFRIDVADALGYLYDVSPDGQRFLVNVRVGEPIAPITVVLNWMADLKK